MRTGRSLVELLFLQGCKRKTNPMGSEFALFAFLPRPMIGSALDAGRVNCGAL
jgi:hypothetical protein